MQEVGIVGTGVYTPQEKISNHELVASFNRHANANDALLSDSAFIEKASGIKSRYVMDKEGILNNNFMYPRNLERHPLELSLHAKMGVKAASTALTKAGLTSDDITGIIVACSCMPRAYPALAIEIQQELNCVGFAFDLNVACASAAFGIEVAYNSIANNKSNQAILVISPEICTAQLNFKDRDSHFIFGDACSAVVLQDLKSAKSQNSFKILGTKLVTKFSNNIRNSFGYLNRTDSEILNTDDLLFKQEGRRVFKEVLPIVINHLDSHLSENNIDPKSISRLWLHQANLNMNNFIAKKFFGENFDKKMAPIILDEYANTSSCGSVICFDKYHDDIASGGLGVLAAFGAGYSCGSIILEKV